MLNSLKQIFKEGSSIMPAITVKVIKGKTIEQKRGLAKDITEAVVKNLNIDPEAVTIDIVETSKEDLAKGGKLMVDR